MGQRGECAATGPSFGKFVKGSGNTVTGTMRSSGGEVRMKRLVGIVAGAAIAGGVWAPLAQADGGWVAAASSPSHESSEKVWGVNQADAESRALAQCAVLERADDCVLLASGPDCVAIAWDGDQPINHAHGASGGGRDVVIQGAMAAAGPGANDPSSRCTWDPHP